MLSFEQALQIATAGDYTEDDLNYCMEFQDYYYFCENRKDDKRFFGTPHCYIIKENGQKFIGFHSIITMNEIFKRNTVDDKVIKEGYLKDFR